MEHWNSILEKRKKEDEKYLFELQKFLDIVSNVKDDELKERIVYQMAKCDERLAEILEETIKK